MHAPLRVQYYYAVGVWHADFRLSGGSVLKGGERGHVSSWSAEEVVVHFQTAQ